MVHDAPHCWLNLGQVARSAPLRRTHELILLKPVENAHLIARHIAHHITTLFSGYSTIPCASASLSCGIRVHAVCSSITVLTATHSPSANGATVGFFSAG